MLDYRQYYLTMLFELDCALTLFVHNSTVKKIHIIKAMIKAMINCSKMQVKRVCLSTLRVIDISLRQHNTMTA